MLKNPIEFELNEDPTDERINDDGEYIFSVYTSDACQDEFQAAISAIAEMWKHENLGEITFRINIRLRSLYETIYDYRNTGGKIDAEEKPLFDALKKDCQWIIDQINSLEMLPE